MSLKDFARAYPVKFIFIVIAIALGICAIVVTLCVRLIPKG